jgi:hypothetical protein
MHVSTVAVLCLLVGVALGEVEIDCSPPKIIPDAEKAPSVYYSMDKKQCDKVGHFYVHG